MVRAQPSYIERSRKVLGRLSGVEVVGVGGGVRGWMAAISVPTMHVVLVRIRLPPSSNPPSILNQSEPA